MLTIKQAGDHVIGAIRPRLHREVILYVESLSNVQVAELLSTEYHLIAVALADDALQSVGRLRSYLIDFLQATIVERLHLGDRTMGVEQELPKLPSEVGMLGGR